MKYGTYRLVDDWLIITVQKFVYDEPRDNNHLDDLAGLPMVVLNIDWKDDQLVLHGDLRPPIGRSEGQARLTTIAFKRRNLPDLHKHRPLPNRWAGFNDRAEPIEVQPRFDGNDD
jgi:hypothetical protein